MSLDQIASEALRLPMRELAMLAVSLWESLEDPFQLAAGIDDESALALAEKRDREMESDEVTPLSHEELMRRLKR
jgi:hypothetical protein